MSKDSGIDLSPLDPSAEPERWERLVRAITERAAPELARRAQQAGVLSILGRWVWPTLAAATLAAVISGAVLATAQQTQSEVPGGIADAIGLPEPVASWIEEGRGPTGADLLAVMEGGIQ